MKKIIVLLLVVVFVFTLSACNNKNTVSVADTSTSTSIEMFVKPDNYASVLFVSINPQFKLYLDENNNVLAIEPVNDDAKSFSKSIDFENKTVEAVVGNIVEKANEKGFIKENVTVDFEITEQKDGIDNSYILTKVVSAVNQKATELKIEIKTEIKESDKSQITETNSENTQNAENSKPTTSSKTEESTSKPSTTSKPGGSKPTHTHTFSAATCTQPKTCSCGEKKGNALGHKWIEATCKSPKTCQNCGLTNGEKAEHQYQGIYCKFCNNPLDKMSNDKWARIIKNNEFGGYNFAYFDKNVIVSGHCYTEEELPNDVEPFWEFEFKGIKYLVDGTDIKTETVIYSETNEEIIIDVYGFGECFVKIKRVSEQEAKVLINDTELSCMEVDAILKRG